MITFHIITLFPETFSYLNSSILGRAQKKKRITIKYYNPRDFARDPKSPKAEASKHKAVDDKPYGGGPGMVMKAEPVLKAVEKARGRKKNVKIIFFSPNGRLFDSTYACKLAEKYKDIILIAGHYEGVDERVVRALKAERVSIGPYILTGGELASMVVVDAVARQIEGVLGSRESNEEERIASSEVYTRPDTIKFKGKNYKVPAILLEGHHRKIEEWRKSR